MSIINSQPRIGAAGQSTGYKIERSLRFNSADSAYLNRTPASAGNRKTWTWSGWVKRSNIGVFSPIFTAATVAPRSNINFRTDDTIEFRQLTSSETDSTKLVTTQVFRDVGAWYHLVFVQDTTQATSSNRAKIYVNGVQVTAFSTATYPSQDFETLAINNNVVHEIGRYASSTGDGTFPGYMAEINFIDGSAKVPGDFGETDTDTGVWKPKAYSGSYGTNGFYLKFADNSGTTSTTLGKDSSGNSNNWTPNNFSVTAGSGNDSLVDTPTPYGTDTGAGGEVRGNYATLNPLDFFGTAGLSNGNLDISTTSVGDFGTIKVTSGKWYFEFRKNADGDNQFGIASGNVYGTSNNLAVTCFRRAWRDSNNTPVWLTDGSNAGSGTAQSLTTGDILGVALDLDNNAVYFAKNNTWMNSGSPTSGSSKTGAIWTDLSGGTWQIYAGGNSNGCYTSLNAGQRPFAYTAPSGFKALCTQNLPTPTIGATSATQANKYFDVVLRTSNGNVGGTYSTTVNMSNGAFLWDKARSINSSHYLLDSVRGISKTLSSDTTGAEANYPNWFTNFGSSSFTTGSDDYTAGTTVVDWIWAANGSGSSNTQGTISSTVSANTTAGFSIVTYTGNATAGATIGHGLGATPSMIIVKDRVATSGAREWVVYHSSLGNTKAVFLSTTGAAYTGTNLWNNTSPTSAVFTVGNSSEGTNGSGNAMLAYCFAPIAGYSAFGSYTGNGSTDGPFIYTGFRPEWIMIKPSSLADVWQIEDAARSPFNVVNDQLFPNSSAAEQVDSATRNTDFLSNGFKIRGTNGGINQSSDTYIYAAFAANPFKYSLGA